MYPIRILAFLLFVFASCAKVLSQSFLNEFNYLGDRQFIEYKWLGIVSHPPHLILYDKQGKMIDSLEISGSFQGGMDEYGYFVDYYVIDVTKSLPKQGGIAVMIGPALESFISYNVDDPIVGSDGPARGVASELISVRLDKKRPGESIQQYYGEWYSAPATYGSVNRLLCDNMDTTYIDTTLCPGTYFICTLFYLTNEQCTRYLIGSDQCDSLVIYNIHYPEEDPIYLTCQKDYLCSLQGDYHSMDSVILVGSNIVTGDSKLDIRAQQETIIYPGFEVDIGGALLIGGLGCKK